MLFTCSVNEMKIYCRTEDETSARCGLVGCCAARLSSVTSGRSLPLPLTVIASARRSGSRSSRRGAVVAVTSIVAVVAAAAAARVAVIVAARGAAAAALVAAVIIATIVIIAASIAAIIATATAAAGPAIGVAAAAAVGLSPSLRAGLGPCPVADERRGWFEIWSLRGCNLGLRASQQRAEVERVAGGAGVGRALELHERRECALTVAARVSLGVGPHAALHQRTELLELRANLL